MKIITKKIKSIEDYKGVITIVWFKIPLDKEKEYLQKAWESIVTDYESEQINHLIK